MNGLYVSYLIAIALIGILAAVLIATDKYEDGLIGRIGLGLMVFGAFVIGMETVNGVIYSFHPTTGMILWGVAVFMARHTYRFMRWCRSCDRYGWTERAQDCAPKHGFPADGS